MGSIFVKTVSAPQSAEDKLFSQRQESVRKDVEKAFGVLQVRFALILFTDQHDYGSKRMLST
jgi:hypothetical protein